MKYGSIVIGYSFSFGITESNTNGASADFKLPFTHTTFDLNAKAHANVTRSATRSFALSDTFVDLIALDCSNEFGRRKNIAYPVIGSIGAGEIINTYLDLGKSGATSSTDGVAGGVAGPFKDVLLFTTDIGAEVTPKVTIAPLPNRFRLINAQGTFASNRTDIHALTIVIPFPALDDREGSTGFENATFTADQYKSAVKAANTTIAYEFCIERAITGLSGSLPGVIKSPEEYCRGIAFR